MAEIYITQCPAKSCDECCKFYVTDFVNCEIICECKCHNKLKEVTGKNQYSFPNIGTDGSPDFDVKNCKSDSIN
jgi:hypothetical protein